MTEGLSSSEDLWNPYKELYQIVLKHLTQNQPNLCNSELESSLRRHKQNFFALLQNPPKNAKSRDELRKGMEEGIAVKGMGHQILSKDLYQETIILSDMYEMNEFCALDLLCTAQLQMSYHPGLPRGLVAVLLYYDGRKALISALRLLVQARQGVQWSVSINEDVARFITLYTDQLMEGGLFNRIFELLRTLDISKELEKLHHNVALGGPSHRKQVNDLFSEIRILLSDIVFIWATQCGLPKAPTLSLIHYLRQVKLEEEASGKLDTVNMTLQIALLSALDLSILHTREDGEDILQGLPILAHKDYLDVVVKEFASTKPKWDSEGLEAISTFGLSVCIASLRLVSQNQHLQDLIGREEMFIDKAIELKVFEFFLNVFLESKVLYQEEFMYKRIHYLLTDFIVYLYPKVKELRIKADEIARTIQVYQREGLEAPVTLPRNFEYFLLSVAKLYNNNRTKAKYVLDYWSPIEINQDQSYSYHAPPRAVSLFKFVRFAGDMLPSTLFVPYVTLLGSLSTCQQAARNCFNMLKQVGLLLSSTISWDHFFRSFAEYYSNLREETPVVSDTVYGHRGYYKTVSPQEIKGLEAVLQLIRTVADNDEFSRLALCEHPAWAPLTVLLGLVGCSIPIPLKAELLLTLATLSKSSENATQMWENLEASQILITIPSTSSYHPRGVQTELDEVESREEEYPLTRAFLTLLDSLTDLGIPRTLGAGPRKPGFDPYLMFIINSVFLKFNSRSYKNPEEKWKVAALCLKLFDKFLKHYEPQLSDVSPRANEFNLPPGFHLMVHLNNKTDLLNTILDIIHEGCTLFDKYTHFPGEEMLQECILHCLNILGRVLMLQTAFTSLMTSAPETILLTSLTKLLMTVNRRSGRPDHCINIAKYVNVKYRLPGHANSALKLLNLILTSPVVHSHLTNLLFASEDINKEIKYGFVECLDAVSDDDDSQSIFNSKLEILKLLRQCINYSSPNLSQFLLGFDIKKDISKSSLMLPGVGSSRRSCLHSLFYIMNYAIKSNSPDVLLESTYNMLYILSSNVKTSGPVLRFIKTNDTFFINHLNFCYKSIMKDKSALKLTSWLIKSVAVEIKVCSKSKQVKYLKQLMNFLTGLPLFEVGSVHDTFVLVSKPSITEQHYTPVPFAEQDFFMLNLIKYFEAKEIEIEMPTWEIFNPKVLTTLLKSCQTENQQTKFINIKKLHQILNDEVKGLQGTAVMGQIQAINQEIPKVLKYALEINKNREKSTAIVQFVDAWCQIIDVTVIYVPFEILSPTEKQQLCIQLILEMVKKIVKADILIEASKLLSGTILLLLDNLIKCHVHERKLRKITASASQDYVFVLQSNRDILKDILKHMVEWILSANASSEKLKINLYASLVTFLQLTHVSQDNDELKVGHNSYISRLNSSRFGGNELEMSTIGVPTDILCDFGERFVETLCHDCIIGQEMVRILAMESVGRLIHLTGNVNWIMYISGRGYLKHIIQSILDSDNELKAFLEPSVTNYKPLYMYTSKMVFLLRLAGTRIGAELLLEHKPLSCLANMKVYSYHPEISKSRDFIDELSGFAPSLEEQYLKIWLPTFDICNALITTLGSDNKSSLVQIMHFVLSHLDAIEMVLRSGTCELSTMSLKELASITFVIARIANNDLINVLENPDIVQNIRAQLYRLQKLMLSLLPKFILNDSTVRNLVHNSENTLNTYQTSQKLLNAMQVISNCLCYCRNIVANNGIDHTGVGVIFEPNLDTYNEKSSHSAYEQVPSLGVVVQHLIGTVNYHHQEKVTLDRLYRKLKDIPEMSTIDIREFISESNKMQDLTVMREHIYEIINERLEKKKREINHCAFIIEHSLYLIWVHLDYYMLRAIPRGKHFGPVVNQTMSNIDVSDTLASSLEATWKVTTDEISNLKQGLVAIFNDSFTKQLLETVQDLSESDKGLSEALLRKIKRLIQFVPVK